MLGLYVLMIVLLLAGFVINARLKSKFAEYSQLPFRGDMTGAEVAEKMLRDNGINNVKVISVEGQLTDHYNPAEK
ncbi:MAG TPA: zinc metallopeptidase, partial [Chitinophagales bacterium]|nr:zinc metallopeptidase [Chitinophagales bacterium]